MRLSKSVILIWIGIFVLWPTLAECPSVEIKSDSPRSKNEFVQKFLETLNEKKTMRRIQSHFSNSGFPAIPEQVTKACYAILGIETSFAEPSLARKLKSVWWKQGVKLASNVVYGDERAASWLSCYFKDYSTGCEDLSRGAIQMKDVAFVHAVGNDFGFTQKDLDNMDPAQNAIACGARMTQIAQDKHVRENPFCKAHMDRCLIYGYRVGDKSLYRFLGKATDASLLKYAYVMNGIKFIDGDLTKKDCPANSGEKESVTSR